MTLNVKYSPVKEHGEAEVGQGDLHDKTAADTMDFLEVVVAVQEGETPAKNIVKTNTKLVQYIT